MKQWWCLAVTLFDEHSYLCLDFINYASKFITISRNGSLFPTNYVILLLIINKHGFNVQNYVQMWSTNNLI